VRAPPTDSVTFFDCHPKLARGFYVTAPRDRVIAGPYPTAAAAEAALTGDLARADYLSRLATP
jgi:hypothetical protein